MGKHSYGVILDAGSSGTRVYVYNWKTAANVRASASAAELQRLPEVKTKKKWRKKVHPGVSTFGEKPEEVGPEHLAELIDFALEIVPEEEVENTPIFLLATAGMRLLPEHQRAQVLENICGYFQRNTKFQLPDCGLHVQVIPGETEGLYGWIAANYLLGGFDEPKEHEHGNGHHTYGFLDMGGASAQIAFAPNSTESEKHAEDLKLLRLRKVNGENLEHKVFVTTWLGFGANEARRRYVESLLEAYPGSKELPDPCLPVGLLATISGEELDSDSPALTGKEPHLIGTGQFPECLKRTYPLLEKDVPCTDEPCLLNGIHTPAIDFKVNHFVGVSEYWHTTHEIFAMAHKDKAYDFLTYQKQVTELCSRDWDDIEDDIKDEKWGSKVDEKTVEEVCFKASWLINMLHDGIGVPRVGLETGKEIGDGSSNTTHSVIDGAKDRGFLDPFQAIDKVDGTELSWTLGKMVLYASSQMPAAEHETLAVGFGSNTPGLKVPADFQYPSSKLPILSNDTATEDVSSQDWHDRLLNSSYSRRAPGILIFLLILALAAYLLCGRDRRASLTSKFLGRNANSGGSKRPKPGFSLSSKLFGSSSSSGPAYERVLEAGAEDSDSENFELTAMSDDGHSSVTTNTIDPPRTGRTSGWATPANRGLSPDFSRGSPKHKSYFDGPGAAAGAAANGLGITAFERGGLVVRTDSKEKLYSVGAGGAGGGGGSHSRSRTPGSARTPVLTPFKVGMD
jgi:Golgi apyrase